MAENSTVGTWEVEGWGFLVLLVLGFSLVYLILLLTPGFLHKRFLEGQTGAKLRRRVYAVIGWDILTAVLELGVAFGVAISWNLALGIALAGVFALIAVVLIVSLIRRLHKDRESGL